MRNSICSVGLLVTMMVTGGCSLGSAGKSFGSKGEPDSEEVAALKARIVELHRRAVLAEVELARLQRQLAELEGQAPSETAAMDPPAPVGRSDAASRPETPVSPVLDEAGASDLEVSDLPLDASHPTDAPAGAQAGTQVDGANPGIDLTVAAQALYDRGYTLFHRGRFVDSETAFQQFLRRYSATVLGDNAQLWIAEARYARGDVNGALAAYRETATRFPDGNKVPDARLKIGDCLRDLGDTEAARTSYRAVVQDFPSSAAAAIAQERLAQSP